MTSEGICFEKAIPLDIQPIWYLLHANSKMMSEEQISGFLDELYILRFRQRILGVLCGNYYKRQVVIHWVIIHPLYPEKTLKEAMIKAFSAVYCREPENPSKRGSIFSPLQWIQSLKTQFRKQSLYSN